VRDRGNRQRSAGDRRRYERRPLPLTSNHNDVPFRLLHLDVRGAEPEIVELAEIPFVARALAFDGRRFWAHDKNENAIVSFAKPD
jgi:hypothetical protein